MKKYKELEQLVLDHADETDMLKKENLLAQFYRINISVDALSNAVDAKHKGKKEYIIGTNKIAKTDEEIKRFIGRVFYDLLILAEINDVSLEEELETAFKNKKEC
jgi:NTP pyrophosphatase (non-canonical NTP hydrolase)